jgi:hypothetical protein
MGGGKKHKRGSIPSSLSSASKTEFIERTPENDYGVLSDPEENGPSSPVPLLTVVVVEEEEEAPAPTLTEVSSNPTDTKHEQELEQELVQSADADSHSPSEQSATLHVSPHSQPSLQPQHPSSQSQISQDQSSNSLNTLKLKLTTDKNYSKKITLHTFFSYIILAIEIERTSSLSSSSSSIAHISAHNVEKLVEYMIETHSATDDIKTYLRTLGEIDVIKNLISAVIDFNKDQPDHTLDKLLSSEQMELEMTVLNDATATDTATPIMVIETSPSRNAPQTPQSCGFFKCLRRFFSGCCG